MNFKKINQLFPFNRLFRLLVIFAVAVQLIIITYSHFSGYYHIADAGEFLKRLIYSSVLTTLGSFLIAYPDLFAIYYLNNKLPWNNKAVARVSLQFFLTLVLAVIVSTLITMLAHFIDNYEENLLQVLINNALIVSVINLILMIILEARIFSLESNQAKKEAENLNKELTQVKFEVLKSQINPHFMFNSLNVLSSLIDTDVKKAQQFIDEFSMMYRYVLESIEKPVVTIREEMDFVRSYLFLQQIRYENSILLDVALPAELLDSFIPPLSLQLVIENAIKHNIANPEHPLKINISQDKSFILIRNNIQSKISSGKTTKLGQKNMVKRYALIGEQTPEFLVEANHYLVKLPIINQEQL